MNFYTQQHKHYCGIDLPARAMDVRILDQHGRNWSIKIYHDYSMGPRTLTRPNEALLPFRAKQAKPIVEAFFV